MQTPEVTLLSLRPSRVLVLKYYVVAVLLMILSFIIGFGIFQMPAIGPIVATLVTIGVVGLFLFTSLILVLIAELTRLGTKYIVTDFRIIRKVGILRRTENVMPYNKLERVELSQGILDRILGIGSLVVDTGEDQMTIASVRNPRNVEQTVMSRLQKVR
jgi:membrane protein YdbS with pleckstrin-like domain